MKICSNCGSQMPDAASYCINCGSNLKNEMESCPQCGKMVAGGSRYCMYCGNNMPGMTPYVNNTSLGSPMPVPEKKRSVGRTIGCFFMTLIILGAMAGYGYYAYTQHQEQVRLAEVERQEAIEDSLEQVLFEEQTKAEEAKKAEENRLEDISVFIKSLYSYRGEYRNKIVRFYTNDLMTAYKSWAADPEELEGPEALFYEKNWDEGCGTWVIIRNFKTKMIDGTSPDEYTATVEVDVSFAVYSAYEDEDFIQNVSHKDILHLKYEGEWKVDDLIRDGKSVKDAYRSSSSNYGRIVC